MSNLVEQTARFLSGNKPSVQKKSLSDAEIEDLLDKGKEVATAISKDTKKSDEESSNSTLKEKEMSKNARRKTLEPSILRLRMFSTENNLKGNATARWA